MINKLCFFNGIMRNSNNLPPVSSSTAWTLGGTATNISYGIIPWTNPSNVLVDSTSAAIATGTGSFDYTDKLRVTNFGFAIPTGATITGIAMKYRRRSSSAVDIIDDIIQLNLSGTPIGANKATSSFWSNINETPEYGGLQDTWSWGGVSVTNINSSGFGIDIAAIDDAAGTDDCYIEAVWLKIFYMV